MTVDGANNEKKCRSNPASETRRASKTSATSPGEKASATTRATASTQPPATKSPTVCQTVCLGKQHRFAPKIRPEDRSAKRIRFHPAKRKIVDKLNEEFKSPQSRASHPKAPQAKIRNSAKIQGPLGSFASDIFLERALVNLEHEKSKFEKTSKASNIVIVTRNKDGSERLARRLIRMAKQSSRNDLENRIEIIDSYKLNGVQEPNNSPRVIFIPMESLSKVLTVKTKDAEAPEESRTEADIKSDLLELKKYIDLDNLKYFYFEQAHMMGSEARYMLYNYFLDNMDCRVSTGFQEVIATDFCNKFHVGEGDEPITRKIGEGLDRHHFLPSPGQLYLTAMPDHTVPKTLTTSIGLERPRELQVRNKLKNYTFKQDFATNDEWLRDNLIENLEKRYSELTKAGITDPRIMVSTQFIGSVDKIRKLLEAKGYKVGTTNSDDKHKYYADGKVVKCDERIDLLDAFGDKYNFLIHCGALDGEEIPADHTMLFKLASSSENVEFFTGGSYRTPYQFEEEDPEQLKNRPRSLCLLDSGMTEIEKQELGERSLRLAMHDLTEARHLQGADDPGKRVTKRKEAKADKPLILEGLSLDEIRRLYEKATDRDSYIISGNLFGGNPLWLEYLDTKILGDSAGNSLDGKISKLTEAVAQDNGFKVDFPNMSRLEIGEILRGKASNHDNQTRRGVLAYCLFIAESDLEPKDLVCDFPYLTGINDASEVLTLIQNQEKSDDPLNPWGNFLVTSYGSQDELDRLIAEFLFNNLKPEQRSMFYYPEELMETLALLKAEREAENQQDQELLAAFDQFLLCSQERAIRFSAIAAHAIRPNDFPLPDSVSPYSATADLAHLESQGLIQSNEAWTRDLIKALGFGVEDPEAKLRARISEFLYNNNHGVFASAESLAQAASALYGNPNPNNAELLRGFITDLNSGCCRLRPEILNKHFPEIFPLHETLKTPEDQLRLINSLITRNSKSMNSQWYNLIQVSGNVAEIILGFLNSLESDQQNEILRTNKNLEEFIVKLISAKRSSGPVDKDPLVQFYRFMQKNYTKTFDLVKAQAILSNNVVNFGKLASASALTGARITKFALGAIEETNYWHNELKRVLNSQDDEDLKIKLAVKIARFLRETGTSRSFNDIEKISRILLGKGFEVKKDLEEIRNLFRAFVEWLENDKQSNCSFDRTELAREFPDYYNYTDTVATERDLEARIIETLGEHTCTINSNWQARVDQAAATKYGDLSAEQGRARYIASFLKEQGIEIKSSDDLSSNLNLLLGCESSRHKTRFSSFAARVRGDLNDLTVAEINSYYPGALENEVADIDPKNKASLENFFEFKYPALARGIVQNKWQKIINQASGVPFLNTLIDYLIERAEGLASFTDYKIFDSDENLNFAILILTGNLTSMDKQKEAIAQNLILDFIGYIEDDSTIIISGLRTKAHKHFSNLVPLSADDFKLEAKLAVRPDLQLSSKTLRTLLLQNALGITEEDLYTYADIRRLQNSEIWLEPIEDAITRAFNISEDKTRKIVRKNQDIRSMLAEDLKIPSGTQTRPQSVSFAESQHEIDLYNRKTMVRMVRNFLTQPAREGKVPINHFTRGFNEGRLIKSIYSPDSSLPGKDYIYAGNTVSAFLLKDSQKKPIRSLEIDTEIYENGIEVRICDHNLPKSADSYSANDPVRRFFYPISQDDRGFVISKEPEERSSMTRQEAEWVTVS